MAESDIYRAIARNPASIGYPDAVSISQVSLGRGCGFVDLVLLPRTGIRLVLIEAKLSAGPGSLWNVIGQLMKYYASALLMGADGYESLRRYALKPPDTHSKRVHLLHYCGGANSQEAAERVRSGVPMTHDQIELIIALDLYTEKHATRLGQIASALMDQHQLAIHLVVVKDEVPERREWRP
jgi:hypothetical protein